jgi:hypothetical protein
MKRPEPISKAIPEKATGRPPKYGSDEDFNKAINAYFEMCNEKALIPNKAGLCCAQD